MVGGVVGVVMAAVLRRFYGYRVLWVEVMSVVRCRMEHYGVLRPETWAPFPRIVLVISPSPIRIDYRDRSSWAARPVPGRMEEDGETVALEMVSAEDPSAGNEDIAAPPAAAAAVGPEAEAVEEETPPASVEEDVGGSGRSQVWLPFFFFGPHHSTCRWTNIFPCSETCPLSCAT